MGRPQSAGDNHCEPVTRTKLKMNKSIIALLLIAQVFSSPLPQDPNDDAEVFRRPLPPSPCVRGAGGDLGLRGPGARLPQQETLLWKCQHSPICPRSWEPGTLLH